MTATYLAPSSLPVPRILVVDDDAGVRDVCVRALRLQGFQVGSAENGRAALEKLREAYYDLVLTDLQMPEMGGIRLLQELRKLYDDTDVIVFTAYGTFESAREALRLGAVDYLTKPVELEDLERTVSRAVDVRRIRQEKQQLSEIVALYEISQKFTGTLDADAAVREIVHLLWQRFSPETLSLSLLHPEDGQIELLAQRGGLSQAQCGARLPVNRDNAAELLQAHLLLSGEDAAAGPGFEESIILRANNGPVGMLRLTRSRHLPAFGQNERQMLMICASQIGASLDNSRLYYQLKQQNLQTVAALAAAIEARDTHTRGHSEQVMIYAVRLAELAGLSTERVECIRYGALLHDIGKIGIRDHVLLKPSALDDEEQLIMRQHPQIGADILQQITSLHAVVPIIEGHHERIDGLGYPHGRKGDELSEEARILAIADSYDAMTSNRAYRKAMPIDQACALLLKGGGTMWDRRLVEVFVEMVERESDRLRITGERAAQPTVAGLLGRPEAVVLAEVHS